MYKHNFTDFAIAFVKVSDNIIHFWYMIKDNAVSIINKSNPNEKSGLF